MAFGGSWRIAGESAGEMECISLNLARTFRTEPDTVTNDFDNNNPFAPATLDAAADRLRFWIEFLPYIDEVISWADEQRRNVDDRTAHLGDLAWLAPTVEYVGSRLAAAWNRLTLTAYELAGVELVIDPALLSPTADLPRPSQPKSTDPNDDMGDAAYARVLLLGWLDMLEEIPQQLWRLAHGLEADERMRGLRVVATTIREVIDQMPQRWNEVYDHAWQVGMKAVDGVAFDLLLWNGMLFVEDEVLREFDGEDDAGDAA